MTLTPIELLKSLDSVTRPTIALSEGSDPRIIAGALTAHSEGVANVILVGNIDDITTELSAQNAAPGEGIEIHDPASSALIDEFTNAFYELRRHKGVDEAKARIAVSNPITYAAMLVRLGYATGTVGGAIATTSDIVRAAIQVIGKAPDAAMVSSFFLMYPPTDDGRAMLYSDCGLVIDPSSEELVAIAAASAKSCEALLRQTAKIAMLSFSTKGSARHPAVSKVEAATNLLHEQFPNLSVDGELQFDSAFVPSVGQRKAPSSDVAGNANVMIFPNLDAGNIGYKITQRLGGYSAIGPIMQGLSKPANDLSRGCVAEDVTQMIAVTALQALGNSSE
ncbi:phosphate acetyltransferase [Cochlodiniinecator piscidefendens]|uniref:phosphate acetyltransferase n=1 Tax=Cochlodiniinecator piscidefendens TaxID=2715756 RepID=UPI001407C022|nr:phosphate acetyltransferase [Cochlodiniinecator piscidefendens]